MTDPTFGVVIRRMEDEARPLIKADLSIVGLTGPAAGADATMYPLNEPVLLFSNETTRVAKLGTTGFLADAVRGINGQLALLQQAAIIVVVRTAASTNANASLANQENHAAIVGDAAARTGMWAHLLAPDMIGATPRLHMAPGYTGLLANGIATITASTPGVGYTPGVTYPLTFSGGGTGAVQATGHAVANSSGGITTADLVLDTPGAWYTSAPTIAVGGSAPSGTGATPLVVASTRSDLANPVCAAFPAMLSQIRAHAVVESSGTSVANTRAWRETLNSERLITVNGGVKVLDSAGAVIVRPVASRIVGLGVRRDYQKGSPFHSWANQAIYDIVGPAQPLTFSITDGANEGQLLLSENIGIIAKGEAGSDFALTTGGFVFVGTDNAGSDTLWQFYNVTRGRDYMDLMVLRASKQFLGNTNITGHTVQALLNTVGFELRDLQANGDILGYQNPQFQGSQNSPEEIRLGHVKVVYRAEEAPVLRKVTVMSGRYREAIVSLSTAIEQQLNAQPTA